MIEITHAPEAVWFNNGVLYITGSKIKGSCESLVYVHPDADNVLNLHGPVVKAKGHLKTNLLICD